MTARWRVGGRVPHHVYEQLGDEPDRRPWPDGDRPLTMFANPEDAALAVRAVNALSGTAEQPAPDGAPAEQGREIDNALFSLVRYWAENPGVRAVVAGRCKPLRDRLDALLEATDSRPVPSRREPGEQRAAAAMMAEMQGWLVQRQAKCPDNGTANSLHAVYGDVLDKLDEIVRSSVGVSDPGSAPAATKRTADSDAAPGYVWGGGRAGGPADQAARSVPDFGSDEPNGETVHQVAAACVRYARPGHAGHVVDALEEMSIFREFLDYPLDPDTSDPTIREHADEVDRLAAPGRAGPAARPRRLRRGG